ncbi:hypothetical protein [Nonlabens antarcticus]|uniref:hypothetical protein n=1 Tax=Nonlabens antarcticus TaxID=392714 RepID=UPI001890D63D|nr:hypothetical protein [Nonlabens antarcticus]
MQYLFNEEEKNIITELANSKPRRIWLEFIKIIIEFDDYYISLECIPEIAASPNSCDEVMTMEIKKINEIYTTSKNAKLLIRRGLITNLKIVRTLIYFKEPISNPTEIKKEKSRWDRMVGKISGLGKSRIEKMFEGMDSVFYEYIVCHPLSEEANELDCEDVNLVDVGILFQIQGQFAPLFMNGNSFGFNHMEHFPLISKNALQEGIHNYELIAVT